MDSGNDRTGVRATIGVTLAALAVLAAGGCARPGAAPLRPGTAEQPLVVQSVASVPAGPRDAFTLESARHVAGPGGGTIVATVQYGGGCREHDFTAWWDGAWRESYPPQTTLHLRHEAHGDVCRALITRELVIDLSGVPAAAPEYSLTLAGASNAVAAISVRPGG